MAQEYRGLVSPILWQCQEVSYYSLAFIKIKVVHLTVCVPIQLGRPIQPFGFGRCELVHASETTAGEQWV